MPEYAKISAATARTQLTSSTRRTGRPNRPPRASTAVSTICFPSLCTEFSCERPTVRPSLRFLNFFDVQRCRSHAPDHHREFAVFRAQLKFRERLKNARLRRGCASVRPYACLPMQYQDCSTKSQKARDKKNYDDHADDVEDVHGALRFRHALFQARCSLKKVSFRNLVPSTSTHYKTGHAINACRRRFYCDGQNCTDFLCHAGQSVWGQVQGAFGTATSPGS